MTYSEKNKLLQRIFTGQFFVKTDLQIPKFVLFKHASVFTKQYADHIYEAKYDEAIASGALTEKEALTIARKNSVWSSHYESNLSNYATYIEKLTKDLEAAKFNGPLSDSLKKKKAQVETKLLLLKERRAEIISNTAERYADNARHEFLIKETAFLDNNTKLFDKLNDNILACHNLVSLIATLTKLLYQDSVLTEAQVRELARSNPWRLYYNSAKSVHSGLFNRLPQDYTDEQISLLYWSSIYDYAFENTERPEPHVIESDKLFDEWLESQDKKDSKNVIKDTVAKTNAIPMKGGPGLREVFINATPDRWEEVEKLNSPMAKALKQRQFDIVNKEGQVTDKDLKKKLGTTITMGMGMA